MVDKKESVEEVVEEVVENNQEVEENTDETQEEEHISAVDTNLIVKAIKLGLSDEEIGRINPEHLSSIVEVMENKKKIEDMKKAEEEADKAFTIPEDAPEYVKIMAEKMKAMELALKSRSNVDNERNEVAQEQKIDSLFDSLAQEGYKDVFAEGSGRKVGPKFLEARNNLLKEMSALAIGYEKTGRKIPDEMTLAKKAIVLLDIPKKAVQDKKKPTSTVRPDNGSNGGTKQSGRDKAIKALRDKMKNL